MVLASGSTALDAGGEDDTKGAHNGKESQDDKEGDPRHV
jgi:hypothetical protein